MVNKRKRNKEVQIKDKSYHYNTMKIIFTFLVVFAHSSRMYSNLGVISPLNTCNELAFITRVIYSFHMPVYIAITGMVYGMCVDDYGKYRNTKKFFRNKSLRLLIPYFFYGVFYVAPIMCLLKLTDKSYIDYCYEGIMLGMNNRHLWYILVLFEIFSIYAFLNIIKQKISLFNIKEISKKLENKIFIIAKWIILFGLSFLSTKMTTIFCVNSFAYYLIFFDFGIWFNRYYIKILPFLKNYFVILLNIFIVIVLENYVSWFAYIIKAFAGIGFSIGISVFVSEKVMKNAEGGINQVLNKQLQNGFGIYLFHPMIIYIVFYQIADKNINPWVLCSGAAFISYIGSYYLTEIFRKCGLRRLLGE